MWAALQVYGIIGGTPNTIEALYQKANTTMLIISEINNTFNNTFNISPENIVAKGKRCDIWIHEIK